MSILIFRRQRRVAGGNQPPSQPTISAGSLTSSGATFTGSAFSDPDGGDTHAASQWQVTTAADTSYATPVISTGDDATNKTSYAATGLSASTNYIARVSYKDSAGNYSAWSADAAFATGAASVTVNTPTTASTGLTATSLAVAHTVPAGAKYLLVEITYRKNGAQTITGVASDVGGALTSLQGAWEVTATGIYHAVYVLTNPAAGAHNVTVTLDVSVNRLTVAAMSVSGATSLTSTIAHASNTAPSVTIAAAADRLVIAAIAYYNAASTLTISETEIANSTGDATTSGCRQQVFSKTGAASTTVSGTLSVTQDWVASAVAFAP